MLDLNSLHAFYNAGTLGGVGAAARKLNVTQPAVSQRLRSLENRLKKKLYGRAENRFVLTEDGRELLQACRPAFEIFASLERVISGKRLELQGNIRIIALSEFSKAFLLPTIKEFRIKYPGVTFQMEYRLSSEMIPLLLRNAADLVFTNQLYERLRLEAAPVFEEEYILAGPKPARRFSWKDLERLPWLSVRSEDNYWFQFMQAVSKHGIKLPLPALEVAEVESLLNLAAEGAGYALVPFHAIKLRRLKKLAIHETPVPNVKQKIYICRLKTLAPSRAAQMFWDFLLKRSNPKLRYSDQN